MASGLLLQMQSSLFASADHSQSYVSKTRVAAHQERTDMVPFNVAEKSPLSDVFSNRHNLVTGLGTCDF